jgi:GNAT superfamily N-acetyltransferase
MVRVSQPREGLPAYHEPPQVCDLVSYGSNVVACCTEALAEPVASWLDSLDAVHDAFETLELYRLNELLAPAGARVQYQAEYFLPDVDAVFAAEPPCPFELRVLGPEDFRDLYLPAWSNALCDKRPQLDVLGVGAYDGSTLVGLAGCSADCAYMWQIGIDVLPSHRRQGIATALTNRLARETFARGKVPFYCAAWSNVMSVRNALASGFKPAWVEVTARPLTKD